MLNTNRIDTDLKDLETAILICAIGLPCCLAIGLWLYRAANPVLGFVFLGLCGAILLRGLQHTYEWIEERREIKAFKQHTSPYFIHSLGEDETMEDDTSVSARVKYAILMFKKAKNPHCITIYSCMFRDACVFAYTLDEDADVCKQEKIFREENGKPVLTVRETRSEYLLFWAKFRADVEQQALIDARRDNASDGWVNAHWFGQQPLKSE